MSAFISEQAENAPRLDIGLLYRIEQKKDGIHLLMSSRCPPDAGALSRRGYVLPPGRTKDVSALEDALVSGRTLRFELLAAPCKKVSGEQKNSRRVFLHTAEERAEWLIRQGDKYGFALLNAQEDAQIVSVNGRRRGDTIHYDAVRFTGVLKVTDAAAFWQVYRNGVGPGKSYGLGC